MQPSSCCHEGIPIPNPCELKMLQKENTSAFTRALNSVCRVSLFVFSMMIAPNLTAPAFQIGAILGAAYEIAKPWIGDPLPRGCRLKPFCGEAHMEFLSDTVYPDWVVRVVTVVFVGAHLRHDPEFTAPFVGSFIGFWAGREITASALGLAQKSMSYIT